MLIFLGWPAFVSSSVHWYWLAGAYSRENLFSGCWLAVVRREFCVGLDARLKNRRVEGNGWLWLDGTGSAPI